MRRYNHIIPMEYEVNEPAMKAVPTYGGLPFFGEASGAIASFVTDIPYRLKKLLVDVDAVQDLHGYDHPWVGGAGKNKFHFSAGRSAYSWSDGFGFSAISAGDDGVTFNGTATSGHTFSVTDASMTLPAGTYRVTTQSGDIGLSIMVNGSAIVTGYGTSGASFTLNAETEIGFSITVVNGASFSNKFVGFQIENGETASDWTPYSNICPISGWTGTKVTVSDIPPVDIVWDENSDGKYIGANGTIGNSSGFHYSELLPVNPKEYIYTFTTSMPNGITTRVHGYDSNGTWVKQLAFASVSQGTRTTSIEFEVTSDIAFIKISNTGTATDQSILPAIKTVYSISWQTEAGTVYGGTLDVTSGLLTVTHKLKTFDGSEAWYDYSAYSGFYTSIPDMKAGTRQDGISNMLVNRTYTAGMWLGVENRYFFVLGVYNLMGNTVENFKTYLSGHNLQVLYPLGEPQTFQLTPTDVKALCGQNNIWADCGDVDVEYFLVEEPEEVEA